MYQLCTSLGWKDFETSGPLNSCAPEQVGVMNFDDSLQTYVFCDGSQWIQIGQGSGSCQNISLDLNHSLLNTSVLDAVHSIDRHTDADKVVVTTFSGGRLAVIDFSDPSLLSITGNITDSNLWDANDMVVVGDFAYVTSRHNNHLAVVDISDPSDPFYLTGVQSSPTNQMNNVWGVAGAEQSSHVFTISFESGSENACWMHSIDISDPSNPNVVDALNISSAAPGFGLVYCDSIRVRNDTAFVIFSDGGLASIDISVPSSLLYIDSVTNSNADQQRSMTISQDGNHLFSATTSGSRFNVFDINDGAYGYLNYITTLTDTTHIGSSYGITTAGSFILVSNDSSNRLSAIDVSDPSNPFVETSLVSSDLAAPGELTVGGDHALVTGYFGRLSAIDLGCDFLGKEPDDFGLCSTLREVNYDPALETLSYCDGNNWRAQATGLTYSWQTGSWSSCSATQPDWVTGSWGSCSASQPAYTYSAWSACSVSCGGGIQTRTQSCPVVSGTETRSVTCPEALGTESRTISCERSDENPAPEHLCTANPPADTQSCSRTDCAGTEPASSQSCTRGGGSDCHSPQATSQSCNTQPCFTYSYSAWGPECEWWQNCGVSIQQTRSCIRSDGMTVDCSFCGGVCFRNTTCGDPWAPECMP